jgi:hypothetical protein
MKSYQSHQRRFFYLTLIAICLLLILSPSFNAQLSYRACS